MIDEKELADAGIVLKQSLTVLKDKVAEVLNCFQLLTNSGFHRVAGIELNEFAQKVTEIVQKKEDELKRGAQ